MTIKRMTKSQKEKADKVISLLEGLTKEGVTFYLNSTPSLQIGFCRTTDSISYEDWMKFINGPKGDLYYSPTNKVRLENYGY